MRLLVSLSTSDYVIVPVRAVRVEELVEFRSRSSQESMYVNALTRSSAQEWIQHGKGFYLLRHGGALVGQLILSYEDLPDELYIDLISVLDSEKGGIGPKMLLDFAEKKAKSLSASRIGLGVAATNERAIRFYERNGYGLRHKIGRVALKYEKSLTTTV